MRLDAAVLADLLEGCLDPPAADEAAEDCLRFKVKIGAQKGLCVALAGGIADQALRSYSTRCARGTFSCSAQRIKAGGMRQLYQTAVPETVSSTRVWPPYHPVMVILVQTVCASASTALSLG